MIAPSQLRPLRPHTNAREIVAPVCLYSNTHKALRAVPNVRGDFTLNLVARCHGWIRLVEPDLHAALCVRLRRRDGLTRQTKDTDICDPDSLLCIRVVAVLPPGPMRQSPPKAMNEPCVQVTEIAAAAGTNSEPKNGRDCGIRTQWHAPRPEVLDLVTWGQTVRATIQPHEFQRTPEVAVSPKQSTRNEQR
jgi:hypothetical protein